MAQLLRGGRGGQVRLKLLLALLWLGGGQDHEVNFPAHSFARLLDLEDPPGRGARRVNDALNWLHGHRLIKLTRNPGHPATVKLLDETGTGLPYAIPARALADPESGRASPANVYIKLPAAFWTRGWAATLSAPAIAMLLVLLVLERENNRSDDLWVSPGEAKRRFDLSEDTRSRGFKDLEACGLITVGRQPVHADFDWTRVRNVYTLWTFLLDPPESEASTSKQAV